MSDPDYSRFDCDPEALAWARGHVERVAEKYRRFEAQDREGGNAERAQQWSRIAALLERELIGGNGCVITAFDERAAVLRPATLGPMDPGDVVEPREHNCRFEYCTAPTGKCENPE